MADVMQPMVQPPNSMSMLQSRPASADAFQASNASQSYQQTQRMGHTPRSMYNSQMGASGYRGTSGPPVQAYAFQSTPNLRQETRTISAPSTPSIQSSLLASAANNMRQSGPSPSPSTTTSNTSTSPSLGGKRSPSKDDVLNGSRPNSFISLSSSIPDLSLTNFDTTPKASPERYRRAGRRTDSYGSTSQMPASQRSPSPAQPPPMMTARTPSDSSQDAKLSEAAKRYRRRSLGNFENAGSDPMLQSSDVNRPSSQGAVRQSSSQNTTSTIRSVTNHTRSGSNESAKVQRGGTVTPPLVMEDPVKRPGSPSKTSNQANRLDTNPKVPTRGSSSEANKRLTSKSPLSQTASPHDAQSPIKDRDGPIARQALMASSPAAQHLAALSDKDLNKGMKSRLRRAFSFGSAAELRKASGENVPPPHHAKLQKKTPEEVDEEQEEIARQQEAAGIGAGIYSGQGGFTGSTDNLSISSTASSASMMLRKMGKGMKKGGRSLKGLFRPKSVIGVPAADGPVQPSLAQVSMVTVEAERQKVNVNANPADQPGGGTGFPKLERNSLDATQATLDARSSNDRNDSMRKSIVGSEKERAEVLAAVKKGILKRSATNSPMGSPDIRPHDSTPFYDSQMALGHAESIPSTPRDERQSRSLTSTISSNDYFSAARNTGAARSMPSTPQGCRNISFSPRIQFHDVWSSTEYDRRGEVATCNRLTPMLAQQIKEELNTFKMEMEVHEMSKPHTHFF